MEQPTLFNIRPMATTRAVMSARRARLRASGGSSIIRTPSQDSPARGAIPAIPPANSPSPSPAASRGNMTRTAISHSDAEFHMPDEGRILTQLRDEPSRCACGRMPKLHRRTVGARRVHEGRTFKNETHPEYQVLCDGLNPCWKIGCTPPTPWMKSSENAIQHWRVTKALTKGT